jgi:RND family efflux transporter MFP subunit
MKLQPFNLLLILMLMPNTGTTAEADKELNFSTLQPAYRQVTVSGFTRARATMHLITEVSGKIKQIYADIGDSIPTTGQFACLDDTFVKIDIASAENDIAQHAIDIAFFRKQVSRHQQLVEKASVAVSLLDELERNLGNSERAMQSDILRKQRLVELQKRHCIKAPVGWKVIERAIEPGQWIDASTKVARVGDFSSLLIPLSLSSVELQALQHKQNDFTVVLTEFAQPVAARIEHISPAFDEQSHKIRVDLIIEHQLPEKRGGMRVELTLKLPDEFGALLISRQALEERFEEFWLHQQDGRQIRVTLLGYQNDAIAKIISPEIKAGDKFKILR